MQCTPQPGLGFWTWQCQGHLFFHCHLSPGPEVSEGQCSPERSRPCLPCPVTLCLCSRVPGWERVWRGQVACFGGGVQAMVGDEGGQGPSPAHAQWEGLL